MRKGKLSGNGPHGSFKRSRKVDESFPPHSVPLLFQFASSPPTPSKQDLTPSLCFALGVTPSTPTTTIAVLQHHNPHRNPSLHGTGTLPPVPCSTFSAARPSTFWLGDFDCLAHGCCLLPCSLGLQTLALRPKGSSLEICRLQRT